MPAASREFLDPSHLTPRGKPLELLLVEDNPGDVRLAEEAFKAAGAMPHMHVVRDGADALHYLRKEAPFENAVRPDLILLDLNLPKVNGHEVLRAIKSDPALLRIPVIVWTTAKSDSEVAAVYELHANCCVTKPVELDAFFRLIRAAQHFWFEVATLPSS
jgi:CheY-like chemotaxis protein